MRRLALYSALALVACADSGSITRPQQVDQFSLQTSATDTTLQLYLNPDGPLVAGTNTSFVHLRVLIGGSALPATHVLATFTSDNSDVIALPHGGLLDDDRTRVYAVANGSATISGQWNANGHTYTVSQPFTVGESAPADTLIELYLDPEQALIPGDNSVFVHARVVIRGTALPRSEVFTTFTSSDSTILDVPYGGLADDDRTRVFPKANGRAAITASWTVNGATYTGSQEFLVGSPPAAVDTTMQLYLVPDQALVPGDNSVFVYARVLIGGTALLQSEVFTTFSSSNAAVLDVPYGGVADDDRTRLIPGTAGKATITAHWAKNGKTYTGAREFTVGTGMPQAPVDTVVQLYLDPEKALVVGDNSVFVHARVLIGGAALPQSDVFATFTSANSTVLAVPHGGVADDDRTRLHPVAAGSSTITAQWQRNGKTYTGTASYTVTGDGGQPAPPGNYSPTTPHWTHIRTRVTDYYYNWTPALRDTAAGRFDLVLGGNRNEWMSRNPSVKTVPYRVHWSVPQQGSEWDQLVNWFAANPSCDFESAFLHQPGTSKTAENRISATIWQAARWLYNPADECWRQYARHRIAQTLASGWSGVFYDEYARNVWVTARALNSLEHPTADSYYNALEAALKAEKAAFPNALIMVNTAEYIDAVHARLIEAAGAVHWELFNDLLHGVMEERWDFAEARLEKGVLAEFMGRRNWRGWLPPDVSPGNYRDGSLDGFHQGMYRQKMGELASYYLIRPVDPATFYFETNNANWDVSPTAHWLRAQEVDVGTPTQRRQRILNTVGADGQQVVVWARHYTQAYILARTTTDWTGEGYSDASAHPIPLPSPMRLLQHDGTLGPVITQISLRKGEGAVLFKE